MDEVSEDSEAYNVVAESIRNRAMSYSCLYVAEKRLMCRFKACENSAIPNEVREEHS